MQFVYIVAQCRSCRYKSPRASEAWTRGATARAAAICGGALTAGHWACCKHVNLHPTIVSLFAAAFDFHPSACPIPSPKHMTCVGDFILFHYLT
jgi:hypothetical protein